MFKLFYATFVKTIDDSGTQYDSHTYIKIYVQRLFTINFLPKIWILKKTSITLTVIFKVPLEFLFNKRLKCADLFDLFVYFF